MSYSAKVLLVDDEPHIRFYIKALIQKMGPIEVLEACNGEEAVHMYFDHNPDIVFMDVNMPTKNGLEALKEINDRDSDALVVMLTSLASRGHIESAVEGGAIDYIRKDLDKVALQNLLNGIFVEYFEEAV